jgi:hypothetical protein
MKLYRVCLALSIALLYIPVKATTIYCAPGALSTGAGTKADPMAFATAVNKSIVGGDSVIVRGGTYTFNSTIRISKPGSAGNLLHIVAYPGEQPIFDFSAQAYDSANQGILLQKDYIHFKGIIVQGAGDNGLQCTGNYDVIENCVFRWNCDSGLQMKTGSNNYILNCDSYENFDYKSSTIGGNADGFADKQYTNAGTNTYEGCRSWRNSDDGWDHYQAVSSTIYKNCWCYAMAPASYDMTNHIRYTTDKTYIDGFTNHIITNSGNGNGFKLGGDYTVHNATLTNCISVGNKVKGFDQNNNAGTMTLYNCTSYLNGQNYGFSNSGYGTLIIKNCASLATTSSNSFNSSSVTQTNNTWSSGFSCSTTDFVSLDVSQMLGSRKADGSLPDITLLHLTVESALIDKGTNVGLPYNGSAPDLGAYEYSSTSGVKETIAESGYSFFPNPVKTSFTIKVTLSQATPVIIKIVSLTGQTLYQNHFEGIAGDNSFSANIENLKSSSYLCQFSCNQFTTCTKFVK